MFNIARKRIVVLALAFGAVLATGVLPASATSGDAGDIVVANRGSGDLSVIDADSLDVTTVSLPDAAEPMYVNHWARGETVFVGDRANSRVIALDDKTYEVIGTVPVGAGVFHQWTDGRQLWVVGDIDNTVSVVNPKTLTVAETIAVPADITEAGGKPHDVFVKGRHAFVSIVGLDDGVVLRYSTRTFEETGRIVTGGDPHLFVRGSRLYVASQEASTVSAYRVSNLAPLGSATVANAHGIWVTPSGHVLATNIAGGGTDAVNLLDRSLRDVIDTADSTVATPHNLTVDRYGRQVFVTHSGATANQVSVFDFGRRGFGDVVTVTVGTNPFGLALVR